MSRLTLSKRELRDLSWVIAMVCISGFLAHSVYMMRDTWPGLSPAPSESGALFFGFGDKQLSYRMVGSTLQNAGDTGGRTTNFKDYDYQKIEDWLWLADKLDPKSNYVPSLAAYYYSAAKEPDKLRHLLDYLEHVGSDTEGERWRWLAHAVYLARFKIYDQQRALELANHMASLQGADMPVWTKVMPAYVEKASGRKKEARDLLLLTMSDPKLKLEQADINQNCWYINHNLREKDDGLDDNPIFKDFCSAYLATLTDEDK